MQVQTRSREAAAAERRVGRGNGAAVRDALHAAERVLAALYHDATEVWQQFYANFSLSEALQKKMNVQKNGRLFSRLTIYMVHAYLYETTS